MRSFSRNTWNIARSNVTRNASNKFAAWNASAPAHFMRGGQHQIVQLAPRSMNTLRALEERTSGISNKTLGLIAIGAGGAIIAISALQFQASGEGTYADTNTSYRAREGFSNNLRNRLMGAYGYLALSLGATVAASAFFFRSGIAARVMSLGPIPALLVFGVGSLGTMFLTRSLDYHTQTVAKHGALASFIAMQSLMISPLAALGGPLLMKAGIVTASIVGGVSLTAATAPSQTYLSMTGPLGIGCGVLLGASVGSMLFPQVKMLHSIWMYGGLALHGAFVFWQTQRMVDEEQQAGLVPRQHDPINDSIGIYIDTIGIFVRIALMMAGNGGKKK